MRSYNKVAGMDLSNRMTILSAFAIICAYATGKQFHPGSKCMQPLLWKNLPSTQLATVDIAVFPVGSLEAHGPHLPLGTDLMLAEAISLNASNGLNGVAVLPTSPFGASFEHANFPGTIPIHDEHLNGLWDDILSGIAKSGISKIVVVNAHGGQTSNVDLAVRKSRFRDNLLVASFNVQAMMSLAWENVREGGRDADGESAYGIHGGLIETSVMLHIFPSLVSMSKSEKFTPRWDVSSENLRPHDSVIAYGWRSEDLSESGAVGDAASASAEIGSAIFERTTQKLRAVLTDVLEADIQDVLSVPR